MESGGPAKISWLDHDADIRMEASAPSVETLFRRCAIALAEAVRDAGAPGAAETRTVALEGVDPEDLLVSWLNEVLYLAGTERFALREIGALDLGERRLRAELRGVACGEGDSPVAREIKAATYHGLRVECREGEWTARVVFDV